MYKTLIFAGLLLLTTPFATVVAQSGTSQSTGSNSQKERIKPKPSGRPGMPSRDYIDCTHGAGTISFEANFDFYAMTVIIGDEDAPILTASITPDDPTVEVGYLYGDYPVTCITDDGRHFYGTLHF